MQIGRYLQHGIAWNCFGTKEKATGRREDEAGRVRRILLVRIQGTISVYQLFSHEWWILPRFVYTITGRVPEVKIDKVLLPPLQYVNLISCLKMKSRIK